jgi:hypothetical protein
MGGEKAGKQRPVHRMANRYMYAGDGKAFSLDAGKCRSQSASDA